MSLRDWLFMMKSKTQADDYKYKMRLDGISEEDAYLNLDKRNGEVFIDEEMNAFYDEAQYDLGSEGEICGPFLNKKVELIQPKPKKYQLKLYEDDDFSYVARSSYDSSFNYDISDKNEICEFITKFTQEEIDNEKLLKFVEKYGIKEEVKE